ncbi:MAG: Dam family site-specific DNA-(adenine-N6)-methyltransferase [Dehalococcoidia bacterium]|nr:MAG: Dam family site-specific DNA-(adenine-N6)-methyltransferase [Dehalococcoidia bacterium]
MSLPPFVPPIKCQGIKTKMVDDIRRIANSQVFDRWIEPFCGSCVVPLNIQPRKALLCDSNIHIIHLYQAIQSGEITPAKVKVFLIEEGAKLRTGGEKYYYEVRERFNTTHSVLDFLFLNRSCFNGVMRFNRNGKFNVPFGHKPERFAKAYVTKITNQIRRIAEVTSAYDWQFSSADFRQTLATAKPGDLVYVDPPYAGRHVDYFNSWSEDDEVELGEILKRLPCNFILSTWHSNQFRANNLIERNWKTSKFQIITREHFYHVGPTEELRHPMVEALITNFPVEVSVDKAEAQGLLFV